MIEFYGNKIWNDAIDNSTKAYFVMQQSVFDEVARKLEENGLNYYAFSQNGTVKMAVNSDDVSYLKDCIGKKLVKSMDAVQAAKSNKPGSIFGTAEYKEIPEKRYFSSDIDMALQIAEQLRLANVPFSGRIYDDHATLTVTQSDEQLLHEVKNELINQRQKHHHKISQSMIVGNVPLSAIQHRTHLISPLSPETFLAMKPEIDKAGFQYSGLVKADHTLLTIDAAQHEAFRNMLNSLMAKPVFLEELRYDGFSDHQIALLEDTISAYATHGQDESLAFHLDPRMTDGQLLEMGALLAQYVSQSEIDRVLDKQGLLLTICQKRDAYKKELDFYDACEHTDFTSEQKAHLFAANLKGIGMDSLFYTFDSSYTVDEIDEMAASILSGDLERIQELQETHNHAQLIKVLDPTISDFAMADEMHALETESHREIPLEAAHTVTELPEPEPISGDTYEIYRLIEDPDIAHAYRFESLNHLHERGLSVMPENYESIYTGTLTADTTLDSIYEQFNLHHPEDFTGYSLSVGDIIVLNQGDSRTAMFVDTFGFTELPDFFHEQSLEQERQDAQDLFALAYSDQDKGVIGNTPFRFISGKTYHKLDSDTALQIIEQLAQQEIPFSAKIGKHGTTTITTPADAETAYQSIAVAYLSEPEQPQPMMPESEQSVPSEALEPVSAPQPTLRQGDHIEANGKKWAVTKIDGDFSIQLQNLNPSDPESVTAYYGHWQEKLAYTMLPEKGIPEKPNKRRGSAKHPSAAEIEDNQLTLGGAEQVEPDLEERDYPEKQSAPEDAIHAFAVRIGVDETMLRDMMQSNHTEQSINEYGRFDKLKETVNKETAAAYLRNREGTDLPNNRVNMYIDKYLRAAVLTGQVPEATTEPSADFSKEPDVDPITQLDEAAVHAAQTEAKQDYHITDDRLGAGGAKTKFQNNVAAIRLLQELEQDQRLASPAEQEVLSKYVGWGGLPQAFDPGNVQWSAEFHVLQDLLTPDEYDAARASTLNAHYTSPVVIGAMYEALSNLGFDGGRILEPAMGIGNFFGTMPEEMRRKSELTGVELDSITGRIAKQLYQTADIQVKGFEKTGFTDGSFDVAIGNIPFGSYKVLDKDYDQHNFLIHDYFFAKSLDKVKSGGIVAFVTSTGTLDKQNPAVREYLAQHAELLGAIRLPNNAFKANAGTEVTTDILFLQKRTEPMREQPDWVKLGQTETGLPINSYFASHPDMVLGTIVEGNKLYGNSSGTDTMCVPIEGTDLKEQLHEAVAKIHGQISHEKAKEQVAAVQSGLPDIPLHTYTEVKGNIYFKTADTTGLWVQNESGIPKQRMLGMIALRDTTRALLDAQLQNAPDAALHALQSRLSEQYDAFYKKFGLLHSSANKQVFREDAAYGLICSLEKKFTKDKLIEKSDIFTERTIRPPKRVEHVDNALDALTVSIQELAHVDLAFMEQLSGFTQDELVQALRDRIYPVPDSRSDFIRYQTADEYLSGNIREKLAVAKEAASDNPIFARNIPALEAVMPTPLQAGDIDARLGATWIDPKYIQQFMYEVLQTPPFLRADQHSGFSLFRKQKHIEVEYSSITNSWNITGKTADRQSIAANKTFGTKQLTGYQILEDVLNLHDPKVYMTVSDAEGKEKRVLDPDATKLACRKADALQSRFHDWIFKDPERRAELVTEYNWRFNSIRPREYDGSHLEFPGMTESIQLHDHQKNAIAHALYGGNTLFAHSVGAGKTFEMIATAMEGKRLGQHTKALFVVPKHLTEQVGEDFMRLYPTANVLVATNKDFKAENRRELMAKIATGNYDAVVISHSQFGLIPLSPERQAAAIKEQINTLVSSIQQLKAESGASFQVKAMERMKKTLDGNLKKLTDNMAKDESNVTFEELGVDKLFVDEAHEFKNLFSPTKLQNVAGISSSASQKAMDLFLKCRYLDEITDHKGVVFATGTPVSNTITELHTMMRYLQQDTLQRAGMEAFDSWISVFGKPTTEYELAPAGNKWRMKTRIANYSNLPELMSMFKQCADVKTADMLQLKVPDCELHIVETEATPFQKELVAELSDRADEVQAGAVPPEEDNMLRITGDGRKVGLDPRLINPDFEDNPDTKLNRCVENVAKIWSETADNKLTQLIFCDLGVPHKQPAAQKGQDAAENKDEASVADQDSLEEEGPFCVYDDIRQKLMERGIPKKEIAFIHEANSEAQKAALFEKVRSGEVRVLIGSTSKMGTGTNVQDRLVALHDLDIPWRPSDLEQRRGRMVRQGNINEKVHLYRYVTKGTFDAYSYQTLENKQKFISQVITSKSPARSCEDIDQAALSFSEIKAICTGDPRIKEKMTLDNEVKELQLLKSEYVNTQYYLEDKVRQFPAEQEMLKHQISALQTDIAHIQSLPKGEDGQPRLDIVLGGKHYADKTEAGKALSEQCTRVIGKPDTDICIGSVGGFPLSINQHTFEDHLKATLQGSIPYPIDFGSSASYNLKRIESVLTSLEGLLADKTQQLAQLQVDHENAVAALQQPFEKADELETKSERLSVLNDALQEAAKEAAANKESRPRTLYFSRDRLKQLSSGSTEHAKESIEKPTATIER